MFVHPKNRYSSAEQVEVFSDFNYYTILGLDSGCTPDGIKRAYRKLAKLYHPDKNGGLDSGIFSQISVAHRVLSDGQKRKDYDLYRISSGSHLLDSFLTGVSGRMKTKRKSTRGRNRKKRKEREGPTSSPPCYESEEGSGGRKKGRTKANTTRPEDCFQNLFNATTRSDSRIYDGSPKEDATSTLIGIVHNIRGGSIQIPFKSVHHKDMLPMLDPDKVVIDEKETNLETAKGDITMRNERQIFYEDVHTVKLNPLESFPKVVVIPGGGSSIGIDKKKYKCRADLKITIDFNATLLEEGENRPVGMWRYHNAARKSMAKSNHEMRGTVYITKSPRPDAVCFVEKLSFIDCTQQYFYTSKIGELDFLTINLPIKPHHITEEGFCTSLELLDGRKILLSYSKKEIIDFLSNWKKIFDYGPAVPHIIIRHGGYTYRVTNKTMKLVDIGRSPLVVIFTMVM